MESLRLFLGADLVGLFRAPKQLYDDCAHAAFAELGGDTIMRKHLSNHRSATEFVRIRNSESTFRPGIGHATSPERFGVTDTGVSRRVTEESKFLSDSWSMPHNDLGRNQSRFGEGGIRTPGPRKGSTVFETAPFDRSGTSPAANIDDFDRQSQVICGLRKTRVAVEKLSATM